MNAVRKIGYALILIFLVNPTAAQNSGSQSDKKKDTSPTYEKIDLPDIWLNAVWKNIDEVTTEKKSFEVEKVTTVAGVRGAEAEDEATKHLYYRGSMRAPSRPELQEAIKHLEELIASEPTGSRVPEFKHYIIQCTIQLGDEARAKDLTKELLRNFPESKWAKMY